MADKETFEHAEDAGLDPRISLAAAILTIFFALWEIQSRRDRPETICAIFACCSRNRAGGGREGRLILYYC